MTATTTSATPRPGRQAERRTATPTRLQAVWVTATDASGRERPELRWAVVPSADPVTGRMAVPHAA